MHLIGFHYKNKTVSLVKLFHCSWKYTTISYHGLFLLLYTLNSLQIHTWLLLEPGRCKHNVCRIKLLMVCS